jgi:hypothetical protein
MSTTSSHFEQEYPCTQGDAPGFMCKKKDREYALLAALCTFLAIPEKPVGLGSFLLSEQVP